MVLLRGVYLITIDWYCGILSLCYIYIDLFIKKVVYIFMIWEKYLCEYCSVYRNMYNSFFVLFRSFLYFVIVFFVWSEIVLGC